MSISWTRPGGIMAWSCCWWVLVVVLAILGAGQAQHVCNLQKRCDACIQTPDCVWCSKPKANHTEGKNSSVSEIPKCQPSTANISEFCDPENLENPKNEWEYTEEIPLTNVNEKKTSLSPEDKIIQLYPQGIKLKLRKGTPETIKVKYRQAQDYPLDLYYLMDLSSSMLSDKKNLAKLGGTLTSTLKKLTSQFTIGFGSFVDKVMLPFTDESPNSMDRLPDYIVMTYSFRNHLPLSSGGNEFIKKVEDAEISWNQDGPEGCLEALMQVMVCKDAIGWRNQSRRIIVLSTDNTYHSAGDGRLVGVVTPNDEKCHLSGDEYQDYDKYDYPSIAQINKVAKEKGINIIFAVSDYLDHYKELSSLIETSSYGIMNANSTNVVDLVVDQYKQITSVVHLQDNSTNSPVSIRYSSSCLDNKEPEPTSSCSGLNQGSEVIFNLEVEATECPKNHQDKVIVEVKTLQDTLLLEIEFDCSCNCETEGRTENSSDCHNHGALVCGVCECFPNFLGENCLCSVSAAAEGKPEDKQQCTAAGDTRVCSDQGDCVCGNCVCQEEGISGKYCECNSLKCISGEEQRCSGHGTCNCDKCDCDEDYEGMFCECRTKKFCSKDEASLTCSGHGTCSCGKCDCQDTYSGPFCEDCPTCKTGKCSDFRHQVQCLFKSTQCESNVTTEIVDSIEPFIQQGAPDCTFEDETNGCFFSFAYMYRDDQGIYEIHVNRDQECPESAPIMGIVFGLVAGIVAIGLLTLLIWKFVTTIHDRKEFARFENERQNAAWNSDDNPLYKEPTQTVQNPAYFKEG